MASPVRSLLLLIFILYDVSYVVSLCDNATLLSEQVDTMLAEYDKETRPNASVSVKISMDIKHATIREKDSTVHLMGELKMEWEDKRTSWNISEWNCDSVLVNAERLWLPDVTLLNAAATSNGDVDLRARLSGTGETVWIKRFYVTMPVALNLRNWPDDIQVATLKVGSRAYSVDEMDLATSGKKHFVAVAEASSWEILEIIGNSSYRDNGIFKSRVISWNFLLRRRAPAHALATGGIFVAVLVLLAAAGALKPVARASTATCASFVSAMWLIAALLRLPGAYTYPRVVPLFSATCIGGAITTLAAAVVMRIASKTTQAPVCVRSAVTHVSLRWNLTPDADESSREKNGTWCLAATLLDRVFVGALWITLFILAILYVA